MCQSLPLAVGLLKARELSFTAEIIDGEEAYRIGLVNAIVPSNKLEESVNQMAAKIKANSFSVVALLKRLYNQVQIDAMSHGLKLEENIHFISDSETRLNKFSNE